MWLAALLTFFSLQLFYIIHENSKFPTRKVCYFVDLIYYVITFLCSVIIALCYELVLKHDATVWASFIAFISLFNIVLVYALNKVEKTYLINFENYNAIESKISFNLTLTTI